MPRFTKLSDFLPELAHPKDVNGNPSVYVLHYPGFTLVMNKEQGEKYAEERAVADKYMKRLGTRDDYFWCTVPCLALPWIPRLLGFRPFGRSMTCQVVGALPMGSAIAFVAAPVSSSSTVHYANGCIAPGYGKPSHRSFATHYRLATALRRTVQNVRAPWKTIDPERLTNVPPQLARGLNLFFVQLSCWHRYFRVLFWTRDVRDTYIALAANRHNKRVLEEEWIALAKGSSRNMTSSQVIERTGGAKKVNETKPLNSNASTPANTAQSQSQVSELMETLRFCAKTVFQSNPLDSELVYWWFRLHQLQLEAKGHTAGVPEKDLEWSEQWLDEYDTARKQLEIATNLFIECQKLAKDVGRLGLPPIPSNDSFSPRRHVFEIRKEILEKILQKGISDGSSDSSSLKADSKPAVQDESQSSGEK